MQLHLDTSRWPVIEVTNPLSFSDEDWSQLIAQISGTYRLP